ncbi:uncharacterized protein LOC122245748 isoform X2 [Penaeus japonicus]|uniref:uncharacterized protein LOC122245748 isoform X2 n=1 Tax=Penaeus japonicus TaxID=27405 RepID=UPI001C714051|nr:uncharacterized protein LOC122245748 isoform X2 [Penaeus japonicus]
MTTKPKPEECQVCLEIYNDRAKRPRVLPCGHTFCSLCIGDLLRDGSVLCPNCRAKHSASTVDVFPVVFIVEDFVKQFPNRIVAGQPPWKRLGKKMAEVREEQETSFRSFRIGYEADLSQLETYANTLRAWECQHREFNARLKDVIEEQATIKLMLEEEQRKVKEHQREGREQQKQLDAAAESLDKANTVQKLMVAMDNAGCVQAVAEDWIEQCQESFPNVSGIQKSVRMRAAIEKALDVISNGMENEVTSTNASCGNANASNAHVPSAQGTTVSSLTILRNVESIIDDISPKLTVEGILQRDGPMTALLDTGEIFAVMNENGYVRSARLSRHHNEIYVHHLKDVRPPASAHTIPFKDMADAFDLSSTRTFLELAWQDSLPRRVQIRLCPDTWLAMQFLLMCTGEKGPSYVATGIFSDGYRGYKKECVTGGDYDGKNGEGVMAPGHNPKLKAPERAGVVRQIGPQNSTQFSVVIGSGRGSNVDCYFGEVESGLEVLMSAAKAQYEHKANVIVVDCGAIIPL